jgi:chromate transporter
VVRDRSTDQPVNLITVQLDEMRRRWINGATMSSESFASADAPPVIPRPSLGRLFAIWLHIGATSFGGGVATQMLIYRNFVSQRKWMTPEEFAQDWAIIQFAPGINLIALAVTIGRRFGGAAGIAVSMFGMLAPAVAITIAMTALYVQVRDEPAVAGALRGITPALVGLSAAFLWRLLKGPMGALWEQGRPAFTVGVALIALTAALTFAGLPVLLAYLAGAVGLGIWYGLRKAA